MLRQLPFRTFNDIASLGLEVHVYCASCYRTVGPIDLGDERPRGRPFACTRFVCSQARRIYDGAPRVCGCLGHIIVRAKAGGLHPACQVDTLVQHLLSAMRADLGDQSGRQASAAMEQHLDNSRHTARLPSLPIGIDDELAGWPRHPVYRELQATL